MRDANGPALADDIWVPIFQVVPGPSETESLILMVVHYSIEFHSRKEAHDSICLRYAYYVKQHHQNTSVVFDECENEPLISTIHTKGEPEGK